MIIILLRGFSNSGKDFVGTILSSKYNYKQFSFANSLKRIIAEKYNIPLNQLYSQKGKSMVCNNDIFKRTYRQLLIDDALKLKENDEDIFAKYCCNSIINSNCKNIVITDWRFENELDVLKQYFPNAQIIPVHIIRKNQNKSSIDDISEYHLINRQNDYTIINNMDDTIYDNINSFIKNIISFADVDIN